MSLAFLHMRRENPGAIVTADTEFGSWVGWVGRVGWVGPTQFSILEFFLNLICCCFRSFLSCSRMVCFVFYRSAHDRVLQDNKYKIDF